MLITLNVRDFALIDRLTLDLGPGLNVFTGETGAGKSLVIQAFSLLLGGRASSDLVRRGTSGAGVEARFDAGRTPRVAAALERLGLPADEGEGGTVVLVGRDIGAQAKDSRCFVNGRLSTVAALREIGDELVDLHGQHDHQRLLRPAEHLAMLDEAGDDALRRLRADVAGAVAELRALERRAADLQAKERSRLIERDNLQFQADEVDKVAPRPGEDDELAARHKLLANAERLRGILGELEQTLSGDEGALDRLRGAWGRLDALVDLDPAAGEARSAWHDAVFQLEEASRAVARRLEAVEVDDAELAQAEERLGELHRLTRKYGPTLADVLRYRSELAERIRALGQDEAAAAADVARAAELRSRLATSLPKLTRAREKAARVLEKAVTAEARELGMPAARFKVDLRREEAGAEGGFVLDGRPVRLFSDGADRAEFLITTNEGEEPGPLAKIASGGEVSRVMLAIKAALAARDPVPIMVFDEVDAGVGGETAWAVAGKLHQVSRGCQCLCITHLPQIAAMAEAHYHVGKKVVGGRTVVAVRPLDQAERLEELSRMLGGEGIAARRHAEELLDRAQSKMEAS